MSQIVLSTHIPGLHSFITGKVRDVYDLGDHLLIVASDRISAFDVVLPSGIPDKGIILTQLSAYWFWLTKEIIPNHFVSADINVIISAIEEAGGTVDDVLKENLMGRSMLVKKAHALRVECVARGYISGSLWKEYNAQSGIKRHVHGLDMLGGWQESDKLYEPIFTPSTKASTGHDESISYSTVAKMFGSDLAKQMRDVTLALYKFAAEHAIHRGIIIADTKFEFGVIDDKLILIDEALTPDSSRFWRAVTYKSGMAQPSFDKQYVRDYLETLDWSKTYPGPDLPEDVIQVTADKYKEAFNRLTGDAYIL